MSGLETKRDQKREAAMDTRYEYTTCHRCKKQVQRIDSNGVICGRCLWFGPQTKEEIALAEIANLHANQARMERARRDPRTPALRLNQERGGAR